MIARHWRGVARADSADDYVAHLQGRTFVALQRVPGFLRAGILRRAVADGVEFLVVTEWVSVQAIERFAGADAEAAVVPPEVQAMMVRYEERAVHYERVGPD